MLLRHKRPLADRLAARAVALALVDPSSPVEVRADRLIELAGARRSVLEAALRRIRSSHFDTSSQVASDAADTLHLALRRVANQPSLAGAPGLDGEAKQ